MPPNSPVKEGLLLTPLHKPGNRGRETSLAQERRAGKGPGTGYTATLLPSRRSNHFPIPQRNRNLPDGAVCEGGRGGGAELDTGLGSVALGVSSRLVSARRSGNFPTSHTESLCWWLLLISLSSPVDSGSITWGRRVFCDVFGSPLSTAGADHMFNESLDW